MDYPQSAKKSQFLKAFLYLEFLNAWFCLYIAPLAILAGLLGEFRTMIYSAPRILQPPYNPWIRAGTNTPFIPVCLALGWLLFTWVPHHWYWRTKRPWWFVVAVVKFLITAAFILPIYVESKYLPRPLNSCQNEQFWPDRNHVPYGSLSMYLLISGSYAKNGAYVSSCEKLLALWRYQIAMCILVAVSALSATGIFVFFDRLEFRDEVAEKWSCCS
ncbi:hypothetical protein EYZ11_008384 [Aspergillus tanneri]|uniref:Uncharacterized protein n=1 Tax=Aspergillus tanneri TaxID=1220188 RepID=A0A4S3JAJ6_9EURO|nr:hypothetical protein EYZ11_008384 [Aspergillus tanneri]